MAGTHELGGSPSPRRRTSSAWSRGPSTRAGRCCWRRRSTTRAAPRRLRAIPCWSASASCAARHRARKRARQL